MSIALTLAAFAVCTLAIVAICKRAPLRDDYPDDTDRITSLLISSAHHRDQLDATYREMCELHEFGPQSYGADAMLGVVYDGMDYRDAMRYVSEAE